MTDQTTTKAARIRSMLADGMTIGDVAKSLGVRYQYVYQISQTCSFEIRKSDRVKISVQRGDEMISRAEAIRRMYVEDEMSRGDIAKRLGTSYQIVHQTLTNAGLLKK